MTNEYFNRNVIILPYDDNWPKMFISEQAQILGVMGDKNAIIEHIGSTAVPNLAAKPIIDMMIGVKDLITADACIKPLETIGYEYVQKLEAQFPHRRYLHKGPNLPNKHFHLHMVEINSDFWHKQLFFRDYLREHPSASTDYQRLKENLAKQFQNDVFSYCEAKSEFIQKVLTSIR